jgi:hypothetical protein
MAIVIKSSTVINSKFSVGPSSSAATAEFPAAYNALINNFSGTKIYVKTTGNDSNAGTSESAPKATIQGATSAASTGSMIVVYPGSYTISNTHTMVTDSDKNLQIVCSPGRVKLSGTNTVDRDFHCFGLGNNSSKLYGLIMERNNNGRTDSYMNAFMRWLTNGEAYNCVFREVNASGRFSMHYDNENTSSWLAEGCLYIGSTWLGNYSGGSQSATRYSASNNSGWTAGGVFTGNQKPVTIASDWSVGSTAYGVYYGTYAWTAANVTQNYA